MAKRRRKPEEEKDVDPKAELVGSDDGDWIKNPRAKSADVDVETMGTIAQNKTQKGQYGRSLARKNEKPKTHVMATIAQRRR